MFLGSAEKFEDLAKKMISNDGNTKLAFSLAGSTLTAFYTEIIHARPFRRSFDVRRAASVAVDASGSACDCGWQDRRPSTTIAGTRTRVWRRRRASDTRVTLSVTAAAIVRGDRRQRDGVSAPRQAATSGDTSPRRAPSDPPGARAHARRRRVIIGLSPMTSTEAQRADWSASVDARSEGSSVRVLRLFEGGRERIDTTHQP